MSSHTWAKEMERSGQEGSHVGDRRHREIWSSMHGLRFGLPILEVGHSSSFPSISPSKFVMLVLYNSRNQQFG